MINLEAIKLLRKACYMDDKYSMCFGVYYTQLKKHGLIDGECKPTFYGRKFIRHCADTGVFDVGID